MKCFQDLPENFQFNLYCDQIPKLVDLVGKWINWLVEWILLEVTSLKLISIHIGSFKYQSNSILKRMNPLPSPPPPVIHCQV